MKFVNSFKSATAIALVAATIATAIASTAAPSLAEEPGGILRGTPVTPGTIPGGLTPAIGVPVAPTLEFRDISVANRGYYIAGFKISYNLKSTTQMLDSGRIAQGANFSFRIPSTANKIQIDGQLYNNFSIQPQLISRKQFDRLDTNLCLTILGSQFNPQIETCN